MELDHLKTDAGWKIGTGAGSSLIRFWGRAYTEYVKDARTLEELQAGADAASKRVGIRCLAAELLTSEFAQSIALDKKIWLAGEIAKTSMLIALEPNLRKIVDEMDAVMHGIKDMMRWFVAPGAPFNLYQIQAEYPAIILRAPRVLATKRVAATDVIASLKSAGQRRAVAQLASLARVRNEYGGRVGSVELRGGALLCGVSGSGKTFCARAFASCSGWPFYEATVGGWTLQNSRAESSSWTLNCIRELLDVPIVIFIDEADKISVKGDRVDNWWKGVFTEIMQLLDRSMGEVVLTPTQRENLRNSWIILAGAFQDIYKMKRGPEMLFEEQNDVHITREDIENHSGLPTEFLNRVGQIIEIAPPGVADLEAAYRDLEAAVGITTTDKERRAAARDAVMSLQGFRGLESYAIEAARKALARENR